MTAKPLSWDEVHRRALAFVAEWRGETRESAERQTFWNEWFDVFGIRRRQVAVYEQLAQRASTGRAGFIDVLWPGVIAAEHKSEGKDLLTAEDQILDYLPSLPADALPELIVTSDFARFRVKALDTGEVTEFSLDAFPQNLDLFRAVAGYARRDLVAEEAVSVRAAEVLGDVYEHLEDQGYVGHDLAVLSVRLLFCLFADDTEVWPRGHFRDLIVNRTTDDGSDLGRFLLEVFEVLDTPTEQRQKHLGQELAQLPYINGGLFEDRVRTPYFTSEGRKLLLQACAFDWREVSPAIFGSIFQSVKDKGERRKFGAHYTTEANIMRLIQPLFLDELRAAFTNAFNSRAELLRLRDRIAGLRIFDPAAGSGNFLIIAYRELRRLELDILIRLRELDKDEQSVLVAKDLSKVHVGQFYAIDLDEFPARIAQTAMYLVDHLENLRLAEQFGHYWARFPITDEAHVTVANACRIDWDDVLPAADCDYLLGNPPFIGRQYRTEEQQEDMKLAHENAPGHGVLDYVTAWYSIAARYLAKNPKIRAAFVSTNSITQGENVPALWPRLLSAGIQISFAYRTFKWGNEARNRAAVHVVIVGFQIEDPKNPAIYEEQRAPGTKVATLVRTRAKNINPYLADAPNVVPAKRRTPLIPGIAAARLGSMPNDGGHLVVEQEALDEVRADEVARKYLRPLMGSQELIRGEARHILWLKNATPSDIANSSILSARVQAVREHRNSSKREATRRLAVTPTLFGEDRQPDKPYLAIPEVSSENRPYVPIAFTPADVIATNKVIVVPDADLFLFGIITSAMHMAWMRAVGGRLKSDYQYSPGLVYNTFPFPTADAERKERVEEAAQAVIDRRAEHPDAALSLLYDPVSMPPALGQAHAALDAVVDALYGRRKVRSDLDRQSILFERYAQLAAPLA